MKAEGLVVQLKLAKEIKEPDCMNSTELYVDDELAWPQYQNYEFAPFRPENIKEGAQLRLEIPSGSLTGEAGHNWLDRDGDVRVKVQDAIWQGRANGLAGGMSGACDFFIMNPATALVVETSAWDEPIPLALYEDVRCLAYMALQEEKADVMRRIFEIVTPLWQEQ